MSDNPTAKSVQHPSNSQTAEVTSDPAVDTALLALGMFMPQCSLITDMPSVQFSGLQRDRGIIPDFYLVIQEARTSAAQSPDR